MPIERLEKLFGEVGEAAQRLAQLKAQAGELVFGGRVAHSEKVQSIADLYAQTRRGEMAMAAPSAAPQAETLTRQGETLARALIEALKTVLEGHKPETLAPRSQSAEHESRKGLLQRMPPVSWLEAGLKLGDYVQKQEQAGRAVDGFTRALAVASRFLYGMTTGKVVTASGQRLPWRRAMARALRKLPKMQGPRRLLMLPDLLIRRPIRHLAASGAIPRKILRPIKIPTGATPAKVVTPTRLLIGAADNAHTTTHQKAVSPGTLTSGGGDAANLTGAIPRKILRPMKMLSGGRGLGNVAGAITRVAGAASGGGGGGGAAGLVARVAAGAGAAGAGGGAGAGAAAAAGAGILAAAGPVGVAVGAVVAFVGVLVGAVVALRKFTTGVKESAEGLLRRRFLEYAPYNPTIAAAQARLEAYDIGSKIRYGQATAGTTMQLTQAFIKLREEMGPLNRTLLNVQTLAATLLVHVARGVNLLLKMTAVVPLIDWLVKKLGGEAPKLDMPVETLLRGLEGLQGNRPRNPPPQGGLPPWP